MKDFLQRVIGRETVDEYLRRIEHTCSPTCQPPKHYIPAEDRWVKE